MIAGLSLSSWSVVMPFNVSTPSSNPLLPNARNKNTTAYTRNIRAPNTIRPAPLRKDCSLDIVSSLLSTIMADDFALALNDQFCRVILVKHSVAGVLVKPKYQLGGCSDHRASRCELHCTPRTRRCRRFRLMLGSFAFSHISRFELTLAHSHRLLAHESANASASQTD